MATLNWSWHEGWWSAPQHLVDDGSLIVVRPVNGGWIACREGRLTLQDDDVRGCMRQLNVVATDREAKEMATNNYSKCIMDFLNTGCPKAIESAKRALAMCETGLMPTPTRKGE